MLPASITAKFQSWEHHEEFLSVLLRYHAATAALAASVATAAQPGDAARAALVLAARATTVLALHDHLAVRKPVVSDVSLEPPII